SNVPASLPDRERLLMAWAQAEGDPPAGFRIGPRLHRPGTLAQLRYETFDARGERTDVWQVRALVPRLPDVAAPPDTPHPQLGWIECPPECRAGLARWHGILVTHSGEPGLAAEWVLRMPVGPTFDLGQRSLVTQDILAAAPRQLGLTSRRESGQTVVKPASIRVTLVEACPATVRVGALARLEIFPYAIVPIPRGFRTVRWVQLDGCRSLLEGPGG